MRVPAKSWRTTEACLPTFLYISNIQLFFLQEYPKRFGSLPILGLQQESSLGPDGCRDTTEADPCVVCFEGWSCRICDAAEAVLSKLGT